MRSQRLPARSLAKFLAHNNGLLLDQDGESPDWIEIHNPASQPISLLNWSLTDSATNLTQWRFPDVTVAPDGYLVVFASGKDIRNVGEPLHTNFKLDDAGEYLALVAATGDGCIQFSTRIPTAGPEHLIWAPGCDLFERLA